MMRVAKWVLWLSLMAAAIGCTKPNINKNNIQKFVEGDVNTLEKRVTEGYVKTIDIINIPFQDSMIGSDIFSFGPNTASVKRLTWQTPSGEIILFTGKDIQTDLSYIIQYKVLPQRKISSEDCIDLFTEVYKINRNYADKEEIWDADGIFDRIVQIKGVKEPVANSVQPMTVALDTTLLRMLTVAENQKDSSKIKLYMEFYKSYIEFYMQNEAVSADTKINLIRDYEKRSSKYHTLNKGWLMDLYTAAGMSCKEFKDAKDMLQEAFLFAGDLANNKNIYLEKLADAYVQTAEKFPSHKNEVYMMLTLARGIYHELGTERTLEKIQEIEQLKKKLLEVQ